MKNELQVSESVSKEVKAQTLNMDLEIAVELIKDFAPFINEIDKLARESMLITVDGLDQHEKAAQAKANRATMRKLRCSTEELRKGKKSGILALGKAIDGLANIVKNIAKPAEDHCQIQENFIPAAKQKIVDAMITKRKEKILEHDGLPDFYELGKMTEEDFTKLIDALKTGQIEKAEKIQEQKDQDAKDAEAKRIADVKADAEAKAIQDKKDADALALKIENDRLKKIADDEAAALKIENDKLKKAADDKAAQDKIDKDIADKALEKERAEKQALQDKIDEAAIKKAKEDKEIEDKKKAKEDEEKKAAEAAAMAPDKIKVADWIEEVEAVVDTLPAVKSEKIADALAVAWQDIKSRTDNARALFSKL